MKRLKYLWMLMVAIVAMSVSGAAADDSEKPIGDLKSYASNQSAPYALPASMQDEEARNILLRRIKNPKDEIPRRSFWSRIPKNAVIESLFILLGVLYFKYRKKS